MRESYTINQNTNNNKKYLYYTMNDTWLNDSSLFSGCLYTDVENI